MDKKYIEVGDFVEVRWETLDVVRGWAQYVPIRAGDDWVIQTEDGGLFYVHSYSTIKLILKGEDQ